MKVAEFLSRGAIALAFGLAACAGPSAGVDRGDLQRTWEHAVLALPASGGGRPEIATLDGVDVAKRLAAIAPDRRWPVVLYLHGCTGIGNRSFLRRIAGAGYVVVAPDSMARRYRPLQCDPRSKTGGKNLFVYDFRSAEITYALRELRRSSWADSRNLYLIGASEGGVAAALYRGGEFRARVIAQWTCHGASLVRGIGAPPDTPILTLVRAADPWYDPSRTANQNGDCGAFLADRPNARSIVARGARHDVLADPALVQEIIQFLARHRD